MWKLHFDEVRDKLRRRWRKNQWVQARKWQRIINKQELKLKVKWSRYSPGVAQRVGWGVALLFHDRGTGREWVVSSTPRPHFTPGKDPVPTVQEAGWAPGPVWTGGKPRLHGDSIPDRPARSSVAIPTELPDPQINRSYWGKIVEME